MEEKYDIIDVVKPIVVISISAIVILFAGWAIAWETGYNQGHKVAGAYYEATGELPSSSFVADRDTFHLETKWRVFEYLENNQKE